MSGVADGVLADGGHVRSTFSSGKTLRWIQVTIRTIDQQHDGHRGGEPDLPEAEGGLQGLDHEGRRCRSRRRS